MYLLKRMKNWRWWVALPWMLVIVVFAILLLPFYFIAELAGRFSRALFAVVEYVADVLQERLGVDYVSDWVFEKENEEAYQKAMDDL